MSKGTHEIGANLTLESGGSVTLIVTCAVSGRYRPAVLYGESASPEEHPEVELLSAVVEEREDADGNVTSLEKPEPFDLAKLTAKERAALLDQVAPRALEDEQEASEPSYDEDRDFDRARDAALEDRAEGFERD